MNRTLVGTSPESVKETQSAYQVLILKRSKGGQNTVGLFPPIFNLLFFQKYFLTEHIWKEKCLLKAVTTRKSKAI